MKTALTASMSSYAEQIELYNYLFSQQSEVSNYKDFLQSLKDKLGRRSLIDIHYYIVEGEQTDVLKNPDFITIARGAGINILLVEVEIYKRFRILYGDEYHDHINIIKHSFTSK